MTGSTIILCALFYFIGAVVCYCAFQPMAIWQEGYDAAKKTYSNFEDGFENGYKCAKEHFTSWDEGFGCGFEAGWETALEQERKTDA